MSEHTSTRGRLSAAQTRGLMALSQRYKGVGGSDWFFGYVIGPPATRRVLSKLRYIQSKGDVGAGLLWRITDAGRRALVGHTLTPASKHGET